MESNKRLSSGRLLKPRRAFSPELITRNSGKKVIVTEASGFLAHRRPSKVFLVDRMKREVLLNQIGSIPRRDFTLPNGFFEQNDDVDDLPTTSANIGGNYAAEINGCDDDVMINSDYYEEASYADDDDDDDDVIDHDALNNILENEMNFEKTFHKDVSEEQHQHCDFVSEKDEEYLLAEKTISTLSVISASASMSVKCVRKRNNVVEEALKLINTTPQMTTRCRPRINYADLAGQGIRVVEKDESSEERLLKRPVKRRRISSGRSDVTKCSLDKADGEKHDLSLLNKGARLKDEEMTTDEPEVKESGTEQSTVGREQLSTLLEATSLYCKTIEEKAEESPLIEQLKTPTLHRTLSMMTRMHSKDIESKPLDIDLSVGNDVVAMDSEASETTLTATFVSAFSPKTERLSEEPAVVAVKKPVGTSLAVSRTRRVHVSKKLEEYPLIEEQKTPTLQRTLSMITRMQSKSVELKPLQQLDHLVVNDVVAMDSEASETAPASTPVSPLTPKTEGLSAEPPVVKKLAASSLAVSRTRRVHAAKKREKEAAQKRRKKGILRFKKPLNAGASPSTTSIRRSLPKAGVGGAGLLKSAFAADKFTKQLSVIIGNGTHGTRSSTGSLSHSFDSGMRKRIETSSVAARPLQRQQSFQARSRGRPRLVVDGARKSNHVSPGSSLAAASSAPILLSARASFNQSARSHQHSQLAAISAPLHSPTSLLKIKSLPAISYSVYGYDKSPQKSQAATTTQFPFSTEKKESSSESAAFGGASSFFERMEARRRLNPLSTGLRNGNTAKHFLRILPNDTKEDYFYREILIPKYDVNGALTAVAALKPSNSTDDGEALMKEDTIDICGETTESIKSESVPEVAAPLDEYLVLLPAEMCAADVHRTLTNRTALSKGCEKEAEDGDNDESTVDEKLRARAAEQPVDVAEHLMVLLKYIQCQRLIDLSTLRIAAGSSMFYSMSVANANRLRESLKLYNENRKKSIVASHGWLLRNLPREFLASYLNLLRFLKAAGSNISEYILECCKTGEFERANEYIKAFLAPRIYDPSTHSISSMMSMEQMRNVSVLLVYPQITTEYHRSNRPSTRSYEQLFKNLLPRIAQCVEKVDLHLEITSADGMFHSNDGTEVKQSQLSAELCTLLSVRLIKRRVCELVKRRQNDHIFLAGWGTSCLLNHKVISMVPGVSGLLDFAFPSESASGPRGDVEDEICLTYCPTLFIVGENAMDVNLRSLQHMRKSMIVDTGLVVIGGANHNLYVSHFRLNIERITQRCVERAVVENVVDFMRQVIADLGPAGRDCRELLKPVRLSNMYEVDMTALRCRPPAGVVCERPTTTMSHQSFDVLTSGFRGRPRKSSLLANGGTTSSTAVSSMKQSIMNAFENAVTGSGSTSLVGRPAGSRVPKRGTLAAAIANTALEAVPLGRAPRGRSSTGGVLPQPPSVSSSSRMGGATLFSARNSFSNSLRRAITSSMDQGGAEDVGDVNIPSPSMLNRLLPPPVPSSSSTPGANHHTYQQQNSSLSNADGAAFTFQDDVVDTQAPLLHQRHLNGNGSNGGVLSSSSIRLVPVAAAGGGGTATTSTFTHNQQSALSQQQYNIANHTAESSAAPYRQQQQQSSAVSQQQHHYYHPSVQQQPPSSVAVSVVQPLLINTQPPSVYNSHPSPLTPITPSPSAFVANGVLASSVSTVAATMNNDTVEESLREEQAAAAAIMGFADL